MHPLHAIWVAFPMPIISASMRSMLFPCPIFETPDPMSTERLALDFCLCPLKKAFNEHIHSPLLSSSTLCLILYLTVPIQCPMRLLSLCINPACECGGLTFVSGCNFKRRLLFFIQRLPCCMKWIAVDLEEHFEDV